MDEIERSVQKWNEIVAQDLENPKLMIARREYCHVATLGIQGISATGQTQNEAILNLKRAFLETV